MSRLKKRLKQLIDKKKFSRRSRDPEDTPLLPSGAEGGIDEDMLRAMRARAGGAGDGGATDIGRGGTGVFKNRMDKIKEKALHKMQDGGMTEEHAK